MMRIVYLCFGLIGLGLVYLLLAGCMTLSDKTIPIRTGTPSDQLFPASEPLLLMTWNIGYAGLGEESDFKADGGEMLLPPGKAAVKKNLAGIQDVLRDVQPDVILMQELAAAGFLTRGVNVLEGVNKALPGYSQFFSSDIHTRFFPGFLSLKHGLGTFARVDHGETRVVPITEEPGTIMGFIKRHYHLQVTELDVSGQAWVLINVHLSAFDEGANTRMVQLREVMDLADTYYQQGKAVVVGGDWNMRLAPTDFAYTADDSAQFWIHDFPRDELKPGWHLAIDPAVPSVRTNEQPYKAGRNYTTNIDGLLLSPNVNVESAKGIDLGFRFTDHQPVVFSLRRAE